MLALPASPTAGRFAWASLSTYTLCAAFASMDGDHGRTDVILDPCLIVGASCMGAHEVKSSRREGPCLLIKIGDGLFAHIVHYHRQVRFPLGISLHGGAIFCLCGVLSGSSSSQRLSSNQFARK